MNYKKHYELLILTRLNRVTLTTEYYEKHHILPKSMGGDNSKNNIILLTAREHYIAHLLLYKFSKNLAMTRAFVMISSRLKINNRIYEEARLLKNKTMPKKENHWCWGKNRPDASERMKLNNPMRDINIKELVRIKITGRKNPIEASRKSALSRTGKGNCNYTPIRFTKTDGSECLIMGILEASKHFKVDRELISNRAKNITKSFRKLKDWKIEYDYS